LKRYLSPLLLIIPLVLILAGCPNIGQKTEVEETGAVVIDLDRLIKYKDAYVGDNSAVGGILFELPGNIYVKSFALQTGSLPYIIEVNYGLNGNSNLQEEDLKKYWTEENIQNIFLNNATSFFILVKNVDEVRFTLETDQKRSFRISRKEMEEFYGNDLKGYAQDKEMWLKEVIQNTINNRERIKEFYAKYKTALE